MKPKTYRQEIAVACDPARLHEVRAAVGRLWHSAGLPERTGRWVVLAVDEAVSGLVHHAMETGRAGEIRVFLDLDEVRFRARIEDQTNHSGIDGLTETEADERIRRERAHRLGVFLVREVMDEVTYQFKRGFQDELVLVKFLPPPDEGAST